ncbi:immunoglobulin-like domain-containing protein [Metabacillus fastidiosus]|uniref:immunoglobulin-like domain-containing protein n=1 Tax=Metabacillus fastidiosus TaxID=1458 RepID=UPI002E1ED366
MDVQVDKAALPLNLSFKQGQGATTDTPELVLPTTGANGTTITWGTASINRINVTTGEVNRPSFYSSDVTVTLTATISKGEAVTTQNFKVVIPRERLTGSNGAVTATKE